VIEREFSAWRRLHPLKGIALFLLIAAPWFIAVSMANPEFPHFFFIREHFERFLTDVHERVEPWWWFFVFLPVGSLPWIAMTVQGVPEQWSLDAANTFRPRRFLLIWAAVVLLFFSASHSKLIPYILPAIPALALLTGDIVERMRIESFRKHLIAIALVWLLAIGYAFLGPLPSSHNASPELMRSVFNWAAVAFVFLCASSVAAFALAKVNARTISTAALGFGSFLGITVLLFALNKAHVVASGYELAESIKPYDDPSKPFYSVGDYDQTLPFYLRRTIILVGYRGEMDMGLTQEPQKGLPDEKAFVERWRSDPPGSLAVLKNTIYDSLVAQQLAMKVIGRNGELTAVMKP
jgi:4-amino-4-deoxy-L-arabinose transferase-like glycosyltransferase